jgi:hypothetical protein
MSETVPKIDPDLFYPWVVICYLENRTGRDMYDYDGKNDSHLALEKFEALNNAVDYIVRILTLGGPIYNSVGEDYTFILMYKGAVIWANDEGWQITTSDTLYDDPTYALIDGMIDNGKHEHLMAKAEEARKAQEKKEAEEKVREEAQKKSFEEYEKNLYQRLKRKYEG